MPRFRKDFAIAKSLNRFLHTNNSQPATHTSSSQPVSPMQALCCLLFMDIPAVHCWRQPPMGCVMYTIVTRINSHDSFFGFPAQLPGHHWPCSVLLIKILLMIPGKEFEVLTQRSLIVRQTHHAQVLRDPPVVPTSNPSFFAAVFA